MTPWIYYVGSVFGLYSFACGLKGGLLAKSECRHGVKGRYVVGPWGGWDGSVRGSSKEDRKAVSRYRFPS